MNTCASCCASIAHATGRVSARALEQDRAALEQSALVLEHLVPDRVRIAGLEPDRVRASVLEQRRDHAVQALDLAQDAADVLLDDGIVLHAEAQQLRGGRDAEQRVAQLVRDAGRHLADRLEPPLLPDALHEPRALDRRRRLGGDGREHAARLLDAVRCDRHARRRA